MSNHPVSPPPIPPSSPPVSGVRRVHTISAASRAARVGSRVLPSEEEQQQQVWNDDEVVDPDWVGGIGAVGDKNSGLHRQASLPTRYNRAFPRSAQSRQGGTMTPRTMNSLTAIAAEQGHEGEEEEWENDMKGWNNDERLDAHDMGNYSHVVDSHSGSSQGHSPLSPSFPAHATSPPPAEVNVRRNQSLTYGATAGNVRRMAVNLRRSGTLQAHMERPHAASSHSPPSPTDNEEDFQEEDRYNEEDYQYALMQQQQQNAYGQGSGNYTPTSSIGRSSPWNPSNSANEWKHGGNNNGSSALDEVQRAFSSLELSGANLPQQNQNLSGQGGLPPRLNQQGHGSSLHRASNSIGNGNGNGNGNGFGVGMGRTQRGTTDKLSLVTDIDSSSIKSGPSSAGTNVPSIGHGNGFAQQRNPNDPWEQKSRTLGSRTSNPNLQYSARGNFDASGLPPNPPVPSRYLNQQDVQAQGARLGPTSFGQNMQSPSPGALNLSPQIPAGFIATPLDVPSLIATKGYNPTSFDCKPGYARYFVIKSYTEDDVHKSLKYEIWSSTDPGNKRLDKAFKETAGRGPIYLFFSVNASGHFCGMAEMITAVDYTRSSTVWASDKWKGVFKVRWIFVRDIPNANLRHIKLNNTPERKPVTNSRDTQELLPDAGQEMLRIFFTHPARTSLLQDFAYYELQSLQKMQQQQVQQTSQSPIGSPPQSTSPQPQLSQQHPFALPNPYTQLGMPGQMMPPLQMNSQYSIQNNIMRNPSPVPVNGGQGYAGNF